MMNNQKITYIGILAIILVIAVPTVYAIVEPHIKITMDASQTTKPIQVVDNFGQEVFSVDVDGTVFPAPVIPPTPPQLTTVQSLRHILIGEDTKTSTFTEDVNDQKVLAKWRVDFNSPQDDNGGFFGLPPVVYTHFFLSGFMKNDNADFVSVAFSSSFDDVTIDEEFLTDGNGSTNYQATLFHDGDSVAFCERSNISQNECFITIGYYIPQGTGSTATIRDYIFEVGIILPADATVTQLLP
jgi:hypothetical protein